MNTEEFHRFISVSKGNESNICQICVIKGGEVVYEDSWRGYKLEDPINVNSVTKGIMAIAVGGEFVHWLIISKIKHNFLIYLFYDFLKQSLIKCILGGKNQ